MKRPTSKSKTRPLRPARPRTQGGKTNPQPALVTAGHPARGGANRGEGGFENGAVWGTRTSIIAGGRFRPPPPCRPPSSTRPCHRYRQRSRLHSQHDVATAATWPRGSSRADQGRADVPSVFPNRRRLSCLAASYCTCCTSYFIPLVSFTRANPIGPANGLGASLVRSLLEAPLSRKPRQRVNARDYGNSLAATYGAR